MRTHITDPPCSNAWTNSINHRGSVEKPQLKQALPRRRLVAATDQSRPIIIIIIIIIMALWQFHGEYLSSQKIWWPIFEAIIARAEQMCVKSY